MVAARPPVKNLRSSALNDRCKQLLHCLTQTLRAHFLLRHRGYKHFLSRRADHRLAMLRNMVTSLIKHDRQAGAIRLRCGHVRLTAALQTRAWQR